MKPTVRKITGCAAGVTLALLCLHSEARAHGCSTASAWEGISSNILEQSCFTGCHGSSGNGGMSVSINTDDAWYAALVDRVPVNAAASGVGKLRVDRPARGKTQVTTLPVGTAPTCDNTMQQCFITGIDITASAGTEYVAVSRAGESAPIAVARGASLSLTLGDVDAGVPIAPNQQLDISQWIRNDYWVGPAPYTNTTTGAVYVNLHLASSVTNQAQPLRDDAGSQALFVPPQSYGATAGVWLPTALAGSAKVGIWADPRAVETELADAEGQTLADGSTVAQGYTTVAGGPIAHGCVHANGWAPNGVASVGSNGANWMLNDLTGPVDLSSPLKWGCEGAANVPPRLPGLAGGGPATFCASSSESVNSTNDCTAVPGTQHCRPANLVYGDGVDDGRCSLVGLSW